MFRREDDQTKAMCIQAFVASDVLTRLMSPSDDICLHMQQLMEEDWFETLRT